MKRKSIMRKALMSLFIMMMIVSQSFYVSAATDLTGYVSTSSLTSKTKNDDTQKNYQSTTGTGEYENYKYSASLIQTAEWIDKTNGEATFNISYSATADEVAAVEVVETRSIYLMTDCTAHYFTVTIAAQNIMSLLEMNDYVDVVVSSYFTGSGAVKKFTLKASDFYVKDQSGNITWNTTSNYTVNTITDILNATTEADLQQYEYVYALGYTSGDTNSKGTITGGTFTAFTNSGQHYGQYYYPYYIQEYYEILTNKGLNFEETVQMIYASFDSFKAAYDIGNGSSSIVTEAASLAGFNLSSGSLSDILNSGAGCEDAVRLMIQYDAADKYVASMTYETYNVSQGNYSSTYGQNLLLYTMFLIDPEGTLGTDGNIKRAYTDATGSSVSGTDMGSDVYTYSQSFSQLGLTTTTGYKVIVTVTTTIDDRFDDVTTSGITATTNSWGSVKSISAVQGSSGTDITVEVEFPFNLDYTSTRDNQTTIDEISYEVEITFDATLKSTYTRKFYDSSDDGFAETNIGGTTAVLSFGTVYSSGNTPRETAVSVTADSTKLYKRTFVINYETNPGTGSVTGTVTDSNQYIAGYTLTLADGSGLTGTNSSGTNIVFAGWSTSDTYHADNPVGDGVDPSTINIIADVTFIDDDITVYAVWAVDSKNADGSNTSDNTPDYLQKSVTFNQGNYGTISNSTSGSVEYKYVQYGSSLKSLVPTVEADNGYALIGWRDSDGRIWSTEAVKAMTVAGYDMEFTAIYSASYSGGSSTSGSTSTDTGVSNEAEDVAEGVVDTTEESEDKVTVTIVDTATIGTDSDNMQSSSLLVLISSSLIAIWFSISLVNRKRLSR